MKLGYCDVTRIGDLNARLKPYGLETYQYKGNFKVATAGGDYFAVTPLFTGKTKREILVWIDGYEIGKQEIAVKDEQCEI